jgi:hypothetical protein
MITRSEPNKNLSYEIIDTTHNSNDRNDPEIDILLNNDDFFSEFHEDFENVDQDNLLAMEIDYFENCIINCPNLKLKRNY